jgi:hypothetical protein
MGNSIAGTIYAGSPNANIPGIFYGDGAGAYQSSISAGGLAQFNPAGDGIYGAAYPVAAGIYKSLGYLPQGYDGVDNDQNGTVDDAAEGLLGDPPVPSPDNPNVQVTLSSLIAARLGNHKHVTARSEMLYALLVEGQGPLGSVFKADDFTDKEVQDTDADGLPEFVDAWGNPLQFFRWPLFYHSDLQRGQVITPDPTNSNNWTLSPPYVGMFDQRELDPTDSNQQLLAPVWWSSGYNNAYSGVFSFTNGVNSQASGGVQAFEYYFHRLTEPIPGAGGQYYWDRGSTYGSRRAFYSKFLILSAGPDGQYGVFLYSDPALNALANVQPPALGAASALIANENNAMPFGLDFVDFTKSNTNTYGGTTITYNPTYDPTSPSSGELLQMGADDISNHNIPTSGGMGGGG